MDIPKKAVRIVKIDNTIYSYLNQYRVEFMQIAKEYVVKEYRNLEGALKAVNKFLK